MASMTKETWSPAGHRVTLTVETNAYRGAQPYYVITRWRRAGERYAQQSYVPLVYGVLDERRPASADQRRREATERAETIFASYARDAV